MAFSSGGLLRVRMGHWGGNRVAGSCVDIVHIEEFSRDCFAWRKRISSLIVAGNGLVERQVDGTALDVLHEVLSWQTGS